MSRPVGLDEAIAVMRRAVEHRHRVEIVVEGRPLVHVVGVDLPGGDGPKPPGPGSRPA